MNQLPRLRRIRWGTRAVLLLGIAASIAANVLHADPNPVSQLIAAWPPVALLLTVDLVSRVPVHRRSVAAIRLVATAAIAGIAAWVSYWHMAGVAWRYGERGASAYLLPVSVDGLVVVASVCLVELAGRIRIAESPAESPESPQATAPTQPNHTPAPAPLVEAKRIAESPPTHRPEPAVLSVVPPVAESADASRAMRADDADLIRAAREAVIEALDSGELTHPTGEVIQRAAVAVIEAAAGHRVGQKRAVRIVEAIRDSPPASTTREPTGGEPADDPEERPA